MSNQIKVTCGVILTIRRPNGQVEQVRNTRFGGVIPAEHFAAMVQATKAAGKGDILSQAPMYKMIAPSAAEMYKMIDDHA